MMKTSLLLLTTGMALTTSTVGAIPTILDVSVNSEQIGPYEPYCPNFDLPLTFTAGKMLSQSFSAKMTFYVDFASVGGQNYSDVLIRPGKSEKLTFKIPSSQYLSSSGLDTRLYLVSKNGLLTLQIDFKIYSKQESVVKNINNIKDFTYTYGCKITSNKVYYLKEHLNFSTYSNYFTDDQYYRLNLSQFDFTYEGSDEVTYDDVYIQLVNVPKLISYLKTIPLKINYVNGKMRFFYRKTMFVDPKTLLMSMDAKPGYISTDYFYFPINKKSSFKSFLIQINIKKFGISQNDYTFNCNFSAGNLFVGDCSNSSYCVVGSVE